MEGHKSTGWRPMTPGIFCKGEVVNDQERQEQREWSAGVMGWIWSDEHEMWCVDSERDVDGRLTFACPDELPGYEIEVVHGDSPDWRQTLWTPDTNLNQCFMVVERMREFGWCLALEDFGGSPDRWRAKFGRFSLEKPNHIAAFNDNPCLAILLAARATGIK